MTYRLVALAVLVFATCVNQPTHADEGVIAASRISSTVVYKSPCAFAFPFAGKRYGEEFPFSSLVLALSRVCCFSRWCACHNLIAIQRAAKVPRNAMIA